MEDREAFLAAIREGLKDADEGRVVADADLEAAFEALDGE
jgi:predicted transcriptional regulator